ncbi:unnamed protein product [Durusdinium trenchii]|uniref:Ultraviolet-B receptor UVR8 n=2 Tax=Durusdinium trenchii TaxID=1381693 RepID=A0ABP0QMS6_9DINO
MEQRYMRSKVRQQAALPELVVAEAQAALDATWLGKTALDCAREKGHTGIVDLFAKAKAVNVRATHWYPFYRHTVFQMIQSCITDDYAEGVVLIGIQPTIDRAMTCAEWPSIQEDVREAFTEQKYPFYQGGVKKLEFEKITFKRVELQDLGAEIHVSTMRNKFAIIASCCDTDFDAAATAMQVHNKATPEGHGKVRRAWATAEDMYGRGSHP